MTFKIKNFATIRICSSDVQRSKRWYQEFLGQNPVEDLTNFVSFKVNGICIDISSADEKSPASLGGSVGYWLVDNLDEAIKKATELGGLVYRGPLRVDEVQRTIVQIKDPIGNVIGLEASYQEDKSHKRTNELRQTLTSYGPIYFYGTRPRLQNAQQLWSYFKRENDLNLFVHELTISYITSALSEFALGLFDGIECLKELDPKYKYLPESAISEVLKYRRHVLAHSSKNAGSTEHTETHEKLREFPDKIFEYCSAAATEFVTALRKREIKFDPMGSRPYTPSFRRPDCEKLKAAFNNHQVALDIPSQDQWLAVFETDLKDS